MVRHSVSLLIGILAMTCVCRTQASCLCCHTEFSAGEGFCRWWSEKHAQVDKLGMNASNATSDDSRRIYIAYFRTHARLEDHYMWDLYRKCPNFNASVHDPLLTRIEGEEEGVGRGIDILLRLGTANTSTYVESLFESVRMQIADHMMSEERLMKASGLLDSCERFMHESWTALMKETRQDAVILYEEFRRVGLKLVDIMRFVRQMVEDWPQFPEFRQKTARRMRQVRHEMHDMLNAASFSDVLSQVDTTVISEYVYWLRLESAEGLKLNMLEELWVHSRLVPHLISFYARSLFSGFLVAGATASMIKFSKSRSE